MKRNRFLEGYEMGVKDGKISGFLIGTGVGILFGAIIFTIF